MEWRLGFVGRGGGSDESRRDDEAERRLLLLRLPPFDTKPRVHFLTNDVMCLLPPRLLFSLSSHCHPSHRIITVSCTHSTQPSLASDLQRIVGHCMVLETPDIEHVHQLLKEDPIVRSLTDDGARSHEVPLYRWRHIRDHTLRIDDGRFGYPCLMIGLDHRDDDDCGGDDVKVSTTRAETDRAVLEYLIRSERVIAAGPLHRATPRKDDPASVAVGDLVLFNAKDRDDAIAFAEGMPSSVAGLYGDLRVHFYNTLDVTGKFVSEDMTTEDPSPGYQMREALEYWGYPVEDDQTPWLNW
jgi:uncharacterized protein YciI